MAVKYRWVEKNGKRIQVDERGTERPLFVSDLDERDLQKHKDTSLHPKGAYPKIVYKVDADDGEVHELRVLSEDEHDRAKKAGYKDTIKQGKGGVVLAKQEDIAEAAKEDKAAAKKEAAAEKEAAALEPKPTRARKK